MMRKHCHRIGCVSKTCLMLRSLHMCDKEGGGMMRMWRTSLTLVGKFHIRILQLNCAKMQSSLKTLKKHPNHYIFICLLH